ncbi:unnamed protein product [Gongylonema pulchrum]|uniref:Uncharacterized protein n=1 Tax=Gongylonema pulchrum TaxID=637853 RepID=A0A183D338_9BILA|nr:unnamed protein product [Gongylonema pulchrum]
MNFSRLVKETNEETSTEKAVPDTNSQQRRFSIESSSSGRGGSSGMSSAEGLGGTAEFCRADCNGSNAATYEVYSQQKQQQQQQQQPDLDHPTSHSSN